MGGLSERTIASSFGKVLKRKREAERRAEDGSGLSNGDVNRSKFDGDAAGDEEAPQANLIGDGRMFKPEDISRSLLYAISNNIGQIAYLQSENTTSSASTSADPSSAATTRPSTRFPSPSSSGVK